MPTTVLEWLRKHRYGDLSEMQRDLGIDWREIEQRLRALRDEGLVEQKTFRWDGSQVWNLIEHVQPAGVATPGAGEGE